MIKRNWKLKELKRIVQIREAVRLRLPPEPAPCYLGALLSPKLASKFVEVRNTECGPHGCLEMFVNERMKTTLAL